MPDWRDTEEVGVKFRQVKQQSLIPQPTEIERITSFYPTPVEREYGRRILEKYGLPTPPRFNTVQPTPVGFNAKPTWTDGKYIAAGEAVYRSPDGKLYVSTEKSASEWQGRGISFFLDHDPPKAFQSYPLEAQIIAYACYKTPRDLIARSADRISKVAVYINGHNLEVYNGKDYYSIETRINEDKSVDVKGEINGVRWTLYNVKGNRGDGTITYATKLDPTHNNTLPVDNVFYVVQVCPEGRSRLLFQAQQDFKDGLLTARELVSVGQLLNNHNRAIDFEEKE